MHVASVANGAWNGLPYPASKSPRFAHTIAVHEGDPGKYFAFVGHKEGFFWVDLSGLANSTPTMALLGDEYLYGNPAIPDEDEVVNVAAIVASGDRLFVYADTSPKEIRLYPFDPSTGAVDTSNPATYLTSTPPSAGGVLPFSPGRAFRARFYEDPNGTNGSGHLLLACESGSVFKLAWPGPGGEDTLGVADVWNSDYSYVMQDCRVFDFNAPNTPPDLKILGAKDSEGFAVINF